MITRLRSMEAFLRRMFFRGLFLGVWLMGLFVTSRTWADSGNTPPVIASQSWNELYATTNPTRDWSGGIQYAEDNSWLLSSVPFRQVRYRMEAKVNGTIRFVNATFDAWPNLSLDELRFPEYRYPIDLIPTPMEIPDGDGGTYFQDFWQPVYVYTPSPAIQRNVLNLSIESNLGIKTGKNLLGRLEIWPDDYLPDPFAPSETGASSTPTVPNLLYQGQNSFPYDFDDTFVANFSGTGRGSFQVHNLTEHEIVFAWNNHGSYDPDIGFGNSANPLSPDWTYEGTQSGLDRNTWRLSVSVGSDGIPSEWVVTEDLPGDLSVTGNPVSDANDDTLTLTLSVPSGTLIATVPVVNSGVSMSGSDQSKILVGKPAALNAYLTTSGNLKYQPPLNETVSRTATVTVTDGKSDSVQKQVTIRVNPVNDRPTLNVPASVMVTKGSPVNIVFPANPFADAENDRLTVTLLVNDGSLAGLPGNGITLGGNSKACLLYTSPSPRDRQKSRMPSSA